MEAFLLHFERFAENKLVKILQKLAELESVMARGSVGSKCVSSIDM